MKMASLCAPRPAQVGGELHAAVPVLGEQLGQVVLEDGHAAFAERLHLGFVVVDAGDAVAHFGKADRRNEAHISGPDHTDGNWL
jgi:hypothetical protein